MSTTIVIWDQCGEANLKFFVVPFDCSHLNNKYINSVEISDGEADEINEMTIDSYGNARSMSDDFPLDELRKAGSQAISNGELKVIVCGSIP